MELELELNITSYQTQTRAQPKSTPNTWGTALYAGLISLSVPAYRPQGGMKRSIKRETTGLI